MAYWLTTHWPKKKGPGPPKPPRGVWVQQNRRDLIDRVSPRDLVFVYESLTGPTEIRTYVEGTTQRFPRRRGRQGVVALIEVTDVASQPEGSKPEQFADGRKVWWRYSAPTKSVNSAGFISRKRLTAILNYAPNYVFHGFGEEHSGLKEISRAVFDRLLSEFNAFTVRDEKKHVERGGSHRFGGGGEGPEHKALKRRIAADPAGLLGEPGLTLWEIEWPLATGDKIDLVSKDALGRFVAVEIEVQCGQSEMAGPLQCMKYRALLSYYFDRPLIEVRCILVAHSIHSHVCARCSAHLIETRTVSAG